MAGRDDLVDEGWPVMGPFLLEKGHQDQIQLVDKRSLCLETLFCGRARDDEVDDKVAYAYMPKSILNPQNYSLKSLTLLLLFRQDFPLCHNNIVEDLQTDVLVTSVRARI